MSKRKYQISKHNDRQIEKPFPKSVTITERVIAEEIIAKDGCIRRRAYSKRVRIGNVPEQMRLSKK